MDDVYEPLERYANEFRASFAQNAEVYFDALVAQSGVDVATNRDTIARYKDLSQKLESAKNGKNWIVFCIVLLIILAIVGIVFIFAVDNGIAFGIAVVVIALVIYFGKIKSSMSRASKIINDIQGQVNATKALAEEQMAPLNGLFDWDIGPFLISQTVPKLQFDPYFTQGRLNDLYQCFGWNDSFNQGKSVVASQSGEINGNPFVFAKLLNMNWGTETYTGSITIYWTEQVRGEDGKIYTIQRSQVLMASVIKPKPNYFYEDVLIYGNDAAPNLTFSRKKSNLSATSNGLWNRLKKSHKIRKLEKFSRNLNDSSNYTIMSNKEFEAFFETMDRNNEVEYRLLFTPLAQRQIMALLADDEMGYGDDFNFHKFNKINIVRPEHLANSQILLTPTQFMGFDHDSMRANFLQTLCEYFRSIYFAMAPLLSIPMYQEVRPSGSIYGGFSNKKASFWTHEVLANYYGGAFFQHPSSVTPSILKTHVNGYVNNDVSQVTVTAHSYYTVKRVDYVPLWGGDGCLHHVPVEWLEYLPIENSKQMYVTESEKLDRYQMNFGNNFNDAVQFLQKNGTNFNSGILLKNIFMFQH